VLAGTVTETVLSETSVMTSLSWKTLVPTVALLESVNVRVFVQALPYCTPALRKAGEIRRYGESTSLDVMPPRY